jgi:hypothetical protein
MLKILEELKFIEKHDQILKRHFVPPEIPRDYSAPTRILEFVASATLFHVIPDEPFFASSTGLGFKKDASSMTSYTK